MAELGASTIQYSFDGPHLLGTGGCIRQALPLLGDEFFVVYGDSYGQCSFSDVEVGLSGGRPAGLDDGSAQ